MAGSVFLGGCGGGSSRHEVTYFAMDTVMSFRVMDSPEVCSVATEGLGELLRGYEEMWSVTLEGSEIARANRGEQVKLSPETAELIEFALEMNRSTNGALDITLYPVLREWGFTTGEYNIPESRRISQLLELTGSDKVQLTDMELLLAEGAQIDLGAVAKGYLGDLLSQRFRSCGVTSALLDLGGNIHAIGANPDGSPWRLGIRNPFGDGNIAVLELADKAAVTSGGYERCFTEGGRRYCHILDPSTGSPAESGLSSVTIVGEEGRLCDALSTAVYVMGAEQAEQLWRELGGFDMILIDDEGNLSVTEGISQQLTTTSSFSGTLTVIE